MKFDLDLIKRNSDLLTLAERDSALRRVAGTGGEAVKDRPAFLFEVDYAKR